MGLGAAGDRAFGIKDQGGLSGTIVNGGFNTITLTGLNNGASFRFLANRADPVVAVKIAWNTATAPVGTCDVRLETDDGLGDPSGTLYDSGDGNDAAVSIAPAAGWQTCTFAIPPITNLTIGSLYHVVVICTGAGTNNKLRYMSGTGLPACAMSATDLTTRSNATEVTLSRLPVCTLVFADTTEEACGMSAFGTLNAAFAIYGASRWAGCKFTTVEGLVVRGIETTSMVRVLTPPGNLRVRILDTANNALANSTVTVDKESLLGLSAWLRVYIPFGGLVTLAAGTSYRAVFDSADCDAANHFTLRSMSVPSATFTSTSQCYTTTTDAGTSWLDTSDALQQTGMQLVLDSETAGGGGGGGPIFGGMVVR
jgi:hypothetical protein